MTPLASRATAPLSRTTDAEAIRVFRDGFSEMRPGAAGERPLVHLASCSCGPTPLRIEQALARFQEEKRRTGPQWERWYQDHVFPAHDCFAQLYQVDVSQVVMQPNVSAALGRIARCFSEATRARFDGRHQVVLYRDDFPTIGDVFANYRPFGLEVVLIDSETEEIAPYLNHQTLLAHRGPTPFRPGATGRRVGSRPTVSTHVCPWNPSWHRGSLGQHAIRA